MAALSSSFISTALSANHSQNQYFFLPHNPNLKITKRGSFKLQAAKVPTGVELPKEVPKLSRPLLGFTKTAEIWNSRACMIGLIGTFIVELIFNKGILEMIGVEIGKGLDIPL
ncbi:light-harvesting complex-like protein OHP1, chloroplastic [Solanum dulcamara]|uniref:light-harvesting complex-like protein OHP1, chloroplastic n=1 Tax=Solanum dulcamara TaxID=45834 RepID=UPI002486AE4A|nr:light-harvesting complex-like protein OHP1, chloroplastic [Solanum dulcamara]